MPVTIGPEIRTLADIVQVLTKCTNQQANAAELEICKRPDTVDILAFACGLGTVSVGAGGVLMLLGATSGGATFLPGVVLGAAGSRTAKSYCNSAIQRSTADIE